MSEPDYVRTFREFWAKHVVTNGQLDLDKVARELHDAKVIATEASRTYEELAGIVKPNSASVHVIRLAREQEARHLGYALRDFLELHSDSTADEMRDDLIEWAERCESDGGS